jgi:hypothetical protein
MARQTGREKERTETDKKKEIDSDREREEEKHGRCSAEEIVTKKLFNFMKYTGSCPEALF